MSDTGDAKEEPPDVTNKPDQPDATIVEGNTPCISFHMLHGLVVPLTLKIAGKILGKQVVVLIGAGSTNNFIHTR